MPQLVGGSRSYGGNDYDHLFKVVVVGDSAVGKTCFLLRLVEDYFREHHSVTIGTDFKVKTVEIGTQIVKANIWDLSGEERFRSISNCYFRGAQCLLIAFSVASRKSFENIPWWIQESDSKGGHRASRLLLATKADLEDQRVVTKQEAKIMAERFGMQYFETSAKTGLEVNEAFVSILSAELEKHVGNMSMSQSTSDSFRLTDETTGNQAWCSGYSCYNS